jgi:hypothetical protein
MHAPQMSSNKSTRSKGASKNPTVDSQPRIKISTPGGAEQSEATSNPTLLEGSQDSGGDDSLDLISKNPGMFLRSN